jgi:hypothetical protein
MLAAGPAWAHICTNNDKPDVARNAGAGNDMCDGVGVDDIEACDARPLTDRSTAVVRALTGWPGIKVRVGYRAMSKASDSEHHENVEPVWFDHVRSPPE